MQAKQSNPALCRCHGSGERKPRAHEEVVPEPPGKLGDQHEEHSTLSQSEKAYIYENNDE